jgi:uncharacterized paraquat-inducible protein A
VTFQVAKLWHLNKIIVTPLVVSTTGVIPNMRMQSVTKLDLPLRITFRAQKKKNGHIKRLFYQEKIRQW